MAALSSVVSGGHEPAADTITKNLPHHAMEEEVRVERLDICHLGHHRSVHTLPPCQFIFNSELASNCDCGQAFRPAWLVKCISKMLLDQLTASYASLRTETIIILTLLSTCGHVIHCMSQEYDSVGSIAATAQTHLHHITCSTQYIAIMLYMYITESHSIHVEACCQELTCSMVGPLMHRPSWQLVQRSACIQCCHGSFVS